MNFENMSEFGADLDVLYFSVVYLQRLIKILDKRSLFADLGRFFIKTQNVIFLVGGEKSAFISVESICQCGHSWSLLSVAESRATGLVLGGAVGNQLWWGRMKLILLQDYEEGLDSSSQ